MSTGILSDYAKVLSNVRQKIQAKVVEGQEGEYKKLTTKRTTGERLTTDQGVTGLGMAEFVTDGGIGTFDAPIEGFTKVYVQQQAQKNAKLSFQTYHFLIKKGDSVGLAKEVAKKIMNIAKSIEDMKDYLFQSLLQQGFNTSFNFIPMGSTVSTLVNTVTADGVEYWSQSHLIEDGSGVFSTVIVDGATNSPVFGMSPVEAAHQIHALKTDGRGIALDSELDTVVVRRGSAAHQEAKRIKAMLDKGHYPATTPGTNGSFNEAARVPSFEIVALRPFSRGATALTATSWGMLDKAMNSEEFGFQYIESMPTMIEEIPGQLNRDYIIGGDCLFAMGASDLRNWMWSAGDNSTV